MKDRAESTPGTGLLLSDDMIFTSRITGTAQQLGVTVRAVGSAEKLVEAAGAENPACVLVDLSNPGLRIADLLSGLRAACSTMPRVVAYGSHVDAATLRAARDAGCSLVLPRSTFVEELPQRLQEWTSRG